MSDDVEVYEKIFQRVSSMLQQETRFSVGTDHRTSRSMATQGDW